MESRKNYWLLGIQLPKKVLDFAIANGWLESIQGQQQ